MRSFDLAAREREIELMLNLAPGMPRVVVGDPGRLRQVLVNLLDNAIRFTPEGKVQLELAREERAAGDLAVRFTVRDTGIGIPPEQRKAIFEAFAQADESVTRQYGGTGLGLTISARLVGMMGGEIGLESEPGRGSVFSFQLLFASPTPDQAATRTAALRDAAPPRLSPLEVLVAEDNLVSRTLTTRILRRAGHQVEAVRSGGEALNALKRHSVDVILMDLEMPGMGGLEATRRLREMEREQGTPRLPVIAVTAHAMRGDRERCIEAGMDGYLPKPIRRAGLLETIAAVLPEKTIGASSADDGATDPDPGRAFTALFLKTARGQMLELDAAIRADDAEAARRLAHSIGGAAAMVGAEETAAAAQRLNKLIAEGNPAETADAFRALERALAKLSRGPE